MDSEEAVIEFLGQVPLLQTLPSSSLKRIAQLVQIKRCGKGEHVVREGEKGEGMYFIWEGEAEVCGSFKVEEENRSELHLKKYDYFSCGIVTSVHEADVVALSKLTCLVLPHEYASLMRPMSIWSADDTQRSLLEQILTLEPIEVNTFRGITLPNSPKFPQVFGGQFMGQALAAASKTVDSLKLVHSLHVYFLLAGDLNMPILYQVHRIRDGKSFATRRIEATQKGNIMFIMLASFQKDEPGFDHQIVTMPSVPAPEGLPAMEELREKRLIDPRLPREYRIKVATKAFNPYPADIRFCEPNNNTAQTKTPPRLRFWFRARGKLPDDPAFHRCAVTYISDLIFLQVSLNPHRRKGLRTRSLSLDHSMWFHRPFRADDWILFVIESPTAFSDRGLNLGQMFSRKGELLVSLTQEGLHREVRRPRSVPNSKM